MGSNLPLTGNYKKKKKIMVIKENLEIKEEDDIPFCYTRALPVKENIIRHPKRCHFSF